MGILSFGDPRPESARFGFLPVAVPGGRLNQAKQFQSEWSGFWFLAPWSASRILSAGQPFRFIEELGSPLKIGRPETVGVSSARDANKF